MTCDDCGARCHGDLCADCRLDRTAASIDVDDGTDHECPDCGEETSGEDVVCYRCRDSHEEVCA